jgi:hypothetical protein
VRPELRTQLEEWLRQITYRPGVALVLTDDALEIRVHTIDSRVPRDELVELDVTHRTLLPEFDLRRPAGLLRPEFQEFVRSCVLAMERHESQEWFRVNGRMVVDPHVLDRTTK